MRKPIKIFGLLVIVCIMIFTIISGILYFYYPPEKIKSMIIPHAEKALGRKIKVENARITIFPGFGVTLSGVSIANTSRDGYRNDPFVTAEKITLRVSIGSVFKRLPEITLIRLDKPSVLIESDSSGSFNFDDLATSGANKNGVNKPKSGLPLLPVPITLKKFEITQGQLRYLDQKSSQDIILDEIDQLVQLSIDKELKNIVTKGKLEIPQITFKSNAFSNPLTGIRVSLTHDIGADIVGGNATINSVVLKIQDIALQARGTVTNLNAAPDYNLTIESDTLKVDHLLTQIPSGLYADIEKLTASGIIVFNAAVKGVALPEKPLPLSGNAVVKDVMIKHTDLPKTVNNVNVSLTFSDSTLNLDNLSLKIGENPVRIKAIVENFKQPKIDCTVNAKVNLAEIKDVMTLPEKSSLAGLIDADIRAKGIVDPSDPARLDLRGAISLQNIIALYPPLEKAAHVNGTIDLNSKQVSNTLVGTIGNSDFKIAATIKNFLSLIVKDSTRVAPKPAIDFTVNSSYLNVDEFIPEPKTDITSTKNSQAPAGPLIPVIPGVDMNGKVTVSKLIHKSLTFTGFNLSVGSKNDLADIKLKSGFAGGTIDENLQADLRTANSIKFNNSLTVNQIEVADLMEGIGGFIPQSNPFLKELPSLQKNLSGKISLSSKLNGGGANIDMIISSLNGNIDSRIANGTIGGALIVKRLSGALNKFITINDIDFRDFKALLTIDNNRVYFKNLAMNSSAGEWNASGSVGFDNSLDLIVKNRLTPETSTKVLAVESGLKSLGNSFLKGSQFSGLLDNIGIPSDQQGRVTVLVNLGGTVPDPKASFAGFDQSGSSSSQSQTSRRSVKQQVQQSIQDVKADAVNKLNVQKQQAEEELRRKAQEQQLRLNEEQLKKQVGEKLKKLF